MEKEEIKKVIGGFLQARKEILSAYIFGSFTQAEAFHDVDVGVYLYRDFDRNDLNKFPYGYESLLISQLGALTRQKIDLVVMNNAEILIQQRIINRGILLFSKDERIRVVYENHIRELCIDSQHLRKIQRHYLGKIIGDA